MEEDKKPTLAEMFKSGFDEQYFLNTINGLSSIEDGFVSQVQEEIKNKYGVNVDFKANAQKIQDDPYAGSSYADAFDNTMKELSTNIKDFNVSFMDYNAILEASQKSAAEMQAKFSGINEKAKGVIPTMANLAGSVVGWARDPLNAATVVLTPTTGGMAGIATRAAVTAGTESVLQTLVQPKREELGQEGSFAQGAANVAIAAAGGASAELAFKALGKVSSKAKNAIINKWQSYAAANKTGNSAADSIIADAAEQLVSDLQSNPLASSNQLESVIQEGLDGFQTTGKFDFTSSQHNTVEFVPTTVKPSDGAITDISSESWNKFKEGNTQLGRPVSANNVIEEINLNNKTFDVAEAQAATSMPLDNGFKYPEIVSDDLAKLKSPEEIDAFLSTKVVDIEGEAGGIESRSLLDMRTEFEDYVSASKVFKESINSSEPALARLAKQAEEGYVSKKRVAEINDLVNSLKEDPTREADVQLLQKAQEIFERRIYKRQQIQQFNTQKQLLASSTIDNNLSKGLSVNEAIHSLSFTEPHLALRKGFVGTSFEDRFEANKLLYSSMVADILQPISPKMLGAVSEKKISSEVVKDYWSLVMGKGERSKDAAIRQSSEAIDKLFTRGAVDFDTLGGDIVGRRDYLLGLFSNPRKMLTVGKNFEESKSIWLKEVKSLGIDIDHIKEQVPGINLNGEQLDKFLDKVYDSSISGGLVDIGDFIPKGLRSTANSRKQPRLLRFTSPDAWMKYQEKYGKGDLFNVVTGYVDSISRDVAGLETYGPSPEAFKNSVIRKASALEPNNAAKFKAELDTDFAYNLNSNKVAPYPTLVTIGSNARSLMAASSLGSAVVPAVINDMLGLSQVARGLRGLPRFNATLSSFKELFKPGLEGRSVEAAKMGFLADIFLNQQRSSLSAIDNAYGSKAFKTAANGTLKMSGLLRATEAQRLAHTHEVGFDIARFALEGNFNSLPDRTKNWLLSRSIDEKALARIKEVGIDQIDYHGTKLDIVNANKMFMSSDKGDVTLAKNLAALFADIKEGASPSFNPNAEKLWSDLNKNKLGVLFGGAARTFTGYIAGSWRQQIKPSLFLAKEGSLGPITNFMLTGTTLGIIATQLRDISQGKDPAQLDGNLVLRGMATSGTLSQFGDMLSSSGNNYGGGFTDRFFAPASMFSKAWNLTGGNIGKSIKGKETNMGEDAVRLLQSITPGQNGWYTGLIMKRLIFDQLRMAANPKRAEGFEKQAKRAAKEGQPYWWRPGQLEPDKAPDFLNALKLKGPKPPPGKRGRPKKKTAEQLQQEIKTTEEGS